MKRDSKIMKIGRYAKAYYAFINSRRNIHRYADEFECTSLVKLHVREMHTFEGKGAQKKQTKHNFSNHLHI